MTQQPVPAATNVEFLRWILRRRARVRIRGDSMKPTLSPGDIVFVDTKAYRDFAPHDGDIVVATHPGEPGLQIIKRVDFTDGEHAYLRSDNRDDPRASDSAQFGLVGFDLLIGKVTACVRA